MKSIFCFLLLALAFSLAAQSDNEAIAVLDKLKAKTKSYQTLHIDMQVIVDDAHNSVSDTFPAVLWYNTGKYCIEMMGQIIYSDGKTTWTYLEEVEEVNITESVNSDDDSFINPVTILDNYQSDYKCRFISDRFEKNRPLVEIDLYPVNIESKTYSRLTLKIDKAKMELFSVTYVGKDGVSFLLEFIQMKINSDVPLAKVSFNAANFPDAEIIDMR